MSGAAGCRGVARRRGGWHDGRHLAANDGGETMKSTKLICLATAMAALLSSPAYAQGDRYLALGMLNTNYKDGDGDHRSTGLIGRIGYDLGERLALELHAGASIGDQSGADPGTRQAQMTGLAGGFLRVNTHFGFSRAYAMVGYMHGSRVVEQSGSRLEDEDSNKAFGFGAEVSDDGALAIDLQWMHYFDNRYYSVDAWNLSILKRF